MFAQNRLEEEYRRYRHLLIYRIPTLKFLDIAEINENERRIATQLGDILYSIAEAKRTVTKSAKKNYKEQFIIVFNQQKSPICYYIYIFMIIKFCFEYK